jgi:hypothetical protein
MVTRLWVRRMAAEISVVQLSVLEIVSGMTMTAFYGQ